MSTEAMQLALEALESDPISHAGLVSRKQAVTALRQALEEKREPVAWISDSPTKGNGKQLHWTKSEAWRWSSNITPLYTTPPKREWVGLHGSEVPEPYKYDVMFNEGWWWAEEKLKEKNQ
jgi:hypothetical protein